MNRIFFGLSLIIAIGIGTSCKSQFDYNYEIACQNEGAGGNTYFVKVFVYSKNYKEALKKAKYQAIHGVLFKGLSAGNCGSKPAICSIAYEEAIEYFDNFFKSGKYLQYINLSNDYVVPSSDRTILPDGSLKLGVLVSVNYQALKSEMIKQGYSKSFGGAF